MLCSRCATHATTDRSGHCAECAAAPTGGPPTAWAPPPPVRPVRSVVGLSYAVVSLLAAVAVIDVFAVYAALGVRAATGTMNVEAVEDHDRYAQALDQAEWLLYLSSSLGMMGVLATGIVFIIWFHRTRTNAEVFAPGTLRRGPGWAIASWFIPFANLWIPRWIAGDIWTASELDRRVPRTVLNAWWILWVLMLPVSQIAGRMWERAEEAEAIRQATLALAASSALDIAAAVLAILFVHRLTAMQETKTLAGPQPAPVMAPSF
ncbi:DUF4328 domain-containing protein [Streptomyces sp. MUM 203J]|uniref:DUF4328 domain-containing protein n=1 Tax=Streptomyces sp. MUM 203J TaxID=2791990 RepID=UPI001F032FCF|nr:DUF4328 domain-containing protein [Streptomyces sp. MUM 203J]MCH0541802.1 DUF4328 domain-containing protein [Streptomyces sp. MUM 203J]